MKRSLKISMLLVMMIIIAASVIQEPADAAQKTFRVKVSKVTATSATTSWAKVKGAKGYDIVIGKKVIKVTKPKASIKSLKASSTVKLTVKAFRYKKVKGKKKKVYISKGIATFKTKAAKKAVSKPFSMNKVSIMLETENGKLITETFYLRITSGGKVYNRIFSNGTAEVSLPAGKYSVEVIDPSNEGNYILPDEKGSLTVKSGAATKMVIQIEKAPTFFDVIVYHADKTPIRAYVCIKDEDGNIVEENETVLVMGYNYPVSAMLKDGVYTAEIIYLEGDQPPQQQSEEINNDFRVQSVMF